jgi:hypothetical protein
MSRWRTLKSEAWSRCSADLGVDAERQDGARLVVGGDVQLHLPVVVGGGGVDHRDPRPSLETIPEPLEEAAIRLHEDDASKPEPLVALEFLPLVGAHVEDPARLDAVAKEIHAQVEHGGLRFPPLQFKPGQEVLGNMAARGMESAPPRAPLVN